MSSINHRKPNNNETSNLKESKEYSRKVTHVSSPNQTQPRMLDIYTSELTGMINFSPSTPFSMKSGPQFDPSSDHYLFNVNLKK